MSAPLVFLDIDGVVNVLHDPTVARTTLANGHTVALRPEIRRTLGALTHHWRVEWLSAWGWPQTRLLEQALGIEAPLPLVPVPRRTGTTNGGGDWKAIAAAARVRRFAPSRPVVWIEDGFFPDTRRWAASRGHTLLLDVSGTGLLWSHVADVQRWLQAERRTA